MDLQLRGKRAFVSGSSSGIGYGIALELAAEGCDVVVHGRNKVRTEHAAHEVEKLGVKSAVTVGDLTTDEAAQKVCDEALAAFGKIDILVNNVGVGLRKDAPDWIELEPHEWIDSFQVNFMPVIRLSRRFVPAMKEQRWGRVINISSTVGTNVMNGRLCDYGAAKAALNKFNVDMSKWLGPHFVTVNAIVPGTVMTPQIEEYMQVLKRQYGWPDDREEIQRRYSEDVHPQSVPRLGIPSDIAGAVAFLASPRAGYINGASLRIDGGQLNFM
jgi:NAD(P)-dependent dehydrogenase (short-subunit alcohol dehydrogenase family)